MNWKKKLAWLWILSVSSATIVTIVIGLTKIFSTLNKEWTDHDVLAALFASILFFIFIVITWLSVEQVSS